jgi:hypothetical protein
MKLAREEAALAEEARGQLVAAHHRSANKSLLLLSLLLAALSAVLAIFRPWGSSNGPGAASSAANPRSHERSAALGGLLGPWGILETVHIAIERPDEFITLNHSFTNRGPWFFEGYSPEQLTNLFRADDLSKRQRNDLLFHTKWEPVSNGVYVTPDRELVLGLNLKARQRIYSILAESPVNYYQHLAFKYRSDGFHEWFDRSGLSPATVALVKGLLYRRGNALCFSDMVEVMSLIASSEEQRRLIKTLSRESTLLLKLQIKPDTDVEALVRYWGKEGHAKDIKPLLESLLNVPGGTSVDVAHLLPPFARMRLYTYPFPSEDPMASRRDCFWTAMNFFNEPPDDRFCDFDYTREVIQSQYYPIQDDATYGDIIWLVDAKGRAIHAAVFLAADVVFTKNGAHFSQPWILMRFQDMLAFFPSEPPLRIVLYRLKVS